MATFGTPVTGDNDYTGWGENEIEVFKCTLSETADVSAMSARLMVLSGTGKVRFVIYNDNAGAPGTLAFVTAEATFTNTSLGWISANKYGGGTTRLTAGSYWLGIWSGYSSVQWARKTTEYYPSAYSYGRGAGYSSTEPPPSPWSDSGYGVSDFTVHFVYATYTVPVTGNPHYLYAQQ